MSENIRLENKRFKSRNKLKEIILRLINWILSFKKKFDDWIDKKERIIHLKN